MTSVELTFAIIGIIVALIIGLGQIYIAKRVKDFEIRQDNRDEKRRNEQIYAESTQFIQKYNKDSYESEIYLLPLCVVAYKYNPVYPYRREIYREFCTLTEEVQNTILKRCKIDIKSERTNTYYSDILERINRTIQLYNDDAKERFFYDHGKYFERALLHHGNAFIPNDLKCEIDQDEQISRQSTIGKLLRYDDKKMNFDTHLTNLFAYHQNEKPFSSLLGIFQQSDEFIASYICCQIAKITALYNSVTSDDMETGYVDDYNGPRYMEDLFLDALFTVEYPY